MVRAKNPSSSLEIFGLFFSSSSSFINVFFFPFSSYFLLIFTGLPVWQSQSESGWDLFGVILFFFFPCR